MSYKRHTFIYSLFTPLISLICQQKLGYKPLPSQKLPEEPFILICNHCTDWDPLLVCSSLHTHMYFVASEHIFRWGRISDLILWFADPIPRVKGSSDMSTVRRIMKELHAGHNIGLFAEGNTTWDGITAVIHPTTGKLVKNSGAALVTFHMSGGYFTSPRWGTSIRKGIMNGGVVNIYSSAQLKQMSTEEITAAINQDIHEDAYATQTIDPVIYQSKKGAELLESLLFLCPACHSINTLHSIGNDLNCACGMKVKYTNKCMLEGNEIPFSTVTEWVKWQRAELKEITIDHVSGAIISDDECILCQISTDKMHGSKVVARGTLSMGRDYISINDVQFDLNKISEMNMVGKKAIVFSYNGNNYEIKSDHVFNGYKYQELFQIIKNSVL